MRDLFPGFYRRTEEELSKLWQEGIFVFDTNMLLNVYRYTQKTQTRYFEILDLLKKRNQLWIPYQAAYEYQDRRIGVIQGQLDTYTEVSTILQTTSQKLENSLGSYKSKHGFIDAGKIIEEITDVMKKAKTTVMAGKAKDGREYEVLKKHDVLLEKLEELFGGSIGSPYDNNKLEELYRQAQLRMELRIPPGWEDEDKKYYRKYGDIILWFQLLDFARLKKKSIIFVTDDGKKDWWLPEAKSQERDRPLPELVQEMFIEANVLLHMYQGYKFLQEAESFFKLEENPDVIEEAMAVTEQNTMELDQIKHRVRKPRTFDQFYEFAKHAEIAVREWIAVTYFEAEIIENRGRPDFLMIEPNEKRVGIEVKTISITVPSEVIKTVIAQFGLLSVLYNAQKLDKLIIFVVCPQILDALKVAEILEERVIVPENILIVVGHIGPNDDFFLIATIPQE